MKMTKWFSVVISLGIVSIFLSITAAREVRAQEEQGDTIYLPPVVQNDQLLPSVHSSAQAVPTPGPTPEDASYVPSGNAIQSDAYILSSSASGEIIQVPFTNGDTGVLTSQSYNGLVDVTVSGVGQAAGTQYSDAFYIYTDSTGNPVTPWHPIPPNGFNWTLWINGGPADNYVQPIPSFQDTHVYNFTMNAPGGPLTFAVGDTLTSDNSGEYIVVVASDSGAVKTRFLEAFGELNKEHKPFDSRLPREELLSIQEASLEPAEEAVSAARLLPGATLPSIEYIPIDSIVNLVHIFEYVVYAISGPFLPVVICPDEITFCRLLNGETRGFEASEFQLFDFDLLVGIEKDALEFYSLGDRIVTAIPFLGFGPSFSIVEVESITEDVEFGIIELSIEGVSAVPEQVTIDIKPGDDTNPINPKSQGKIPVAILSTADFDAPTQLNKTLLTFGRYGNEKSLAKCNKSAEDVNDDGLLDQVCHFNTQDTQFQQGDNEGILTGSIADDIFIQGRDSVKIVPAKK